MRAERRPMTKKLPVDLDELIFCSTWRDTMEVGPVSFFDTETGAVVSVEREVWDAVAVHEEDDLSDYDHEQVEIARKAYDTDSSLVEPPELESRERFRMMADFTEAMTSGTPRRKLIEALEGRRPFRRFKDTLLRFPDIREQWFNYEAERLEEWVLEWLKERDIIPAAPDEATGKPLAD